MRIEKVKVASIVNHLEYPGPKDSGDQETSEARGSREGFPGLPLFLGPDQPEWGWSGISTGTHCCTITDCHYSGHADAVSEMSFERGPGRRKRHWRNKAGGWFELSKSRCFPFRHSALGRLWVSFSEKTVPSASRRLDSRPDTSVSNILGTSVELTSKQTAACLQERDPHCVLVSLPTGSSSKLFCSQTLGGRSWRASVTLRPHRLNSALWSQAYPLLVTLSRSFSSHISHLHPLFF